MTNPSLPQPNNAPETSKIGTDRLIGIGKMGCLVSSMILDRGSFAFKGIALNNDPSLFEGLDPSILTFLCDGDGNMRVHGECTKPDQEVNDSDSAPSIHLGGASKWTVIVAGLGGDFTGELIGKVISTLRQQNSMVLVVASLPFDMEGDDKKIAAEKSLNQLVEEADAVIALPNQSYLKKRTQPVKLKEAFELSRRCLAEAVEGVWGMLHADGLTNIRVSHLKNLFQGHHVKGLFASAHADGDDRVRLAVDSLLAHPQMEDGGALKLADACLLQVTGDESLTFKDVDRIKRHIRKHLPADKSLVVGTSVKGDLKDHLSVSIVSAHFSGIKLNNLPVMDGNSKPALETFQVDIEKEEEHPVIMEQEGGVDEELVLSDSDETGAPSVEAAHPMAPPPSSKRSKRGSKRYFQTFLNLGGKKNGRFADTDPTFYNSVNLDEPTYQRKGVVFN
jgi:cell division GTPase FtsZ